jgi:hypothetical protein
MENCGYGNCGHRCNVSAIHLHILLGVGNFYEGGSCVHRLTKYPENHTKSINTRCAKCRVKAGGTYSYHWTLRGQD